MRNPVFYVLAKSTVKNWLQLLRAPNLLTIPGDPLAGFLLASGGRFIARDALPAIAASLCFYCAGLLLNDLADLDEDRRERPARPLPSGSAGPASVRFVMLALLVIGLELCNARHSMLPIGVLLVALIFAYDLALKNFRFAGPFAMSLCRGCNVLLGAAAAWPALHLVQWRAAWPPFAAALLATIYIFFVAILAQKETSNPRIPPLIGALLRGLIALQAAFCLASRSTAGFFAALALLALWPANRFLAARFYAS